MTVYESTAALLSELTSQTGESAVAIYAKWASLTVGPDDSLYRLVCRKLIANGKSAQIEESLEATLAKGGATGTSLEQMLLKTGLEGWS